MNKKKKSTMLECYDKMTENVEKHASRFCAEMFPELNSYNQKCGKYLSLLLKSCVEDVRYFRYALNKASP